MTYHPLNIVERLETLSRSPEQDRLVRGLLMAGLEMQTLDSAHPKERDVHSVIVDPLGVVIFRDRTGARWVVDRQGRMTATDRTEWLITSPGIREPQNAQDPS
jgi:hypothetical protein